jgi:glycosyltransferase involved in cell wall biosynthesis
MLIFAPNGHAAPRTQTIRRSTIAHPFRLRDFAVSADILTQSGKIMPDKHGLADGDALLDSPDLVSVIVPVYNRAHLISRSVGSLLNQSHRNLEVVLVDDCSTDDIEAAVALIGDDRVRLVRRTRNGGAAAARNTGLMVARGELIAFHDSDDICTFDKIERQLALLKSLPADYIGIYTAVIFYYSLSEADYSRMQAYIQPFPQETPLSGDLATRTLRGNSFNLPTLLVKKEALLAAGPSDELMRNNVDWDLALRLTRQGKLGFIAEPMYLTQISLSHSVNRQRISRSSRYSAQSFVRITGKSRRAGLIGPELAGHYASAARHLLKIGHAGFARRFFRAALALTPMKPRLWIHYALTYAPALHARLQDRRRAHP